MRRVVGYALCIALVVLVAMPAVAFARGHGQGLATAPGQVKKEEPPPDEDPAVAVPEAAAQDTGEEAADAAIPPGHESAVGRGHAEAPGQGHAREQLGEDPAVAPDVPGDWGPSEDASGTPDPKRVGIERALERLEANLARAEQKMADGSKWQLPPGLVKTIDKFTEWLGIDDTVEDPGDDGSTDTSPTPDPDDGSSEETETPAEEPPPPIFS